MQPYTLALEQWNSAEGCQALEEHWQASPYKAQAEQIVAGLVAGLPQHDRIVELGCGSGRLVQHLPPFRRYLGFDLSPHLLASAREAHAADSRCTFAERNLFSGAPYKRPVDVLLCVHVARHYPHPWELLRTVVELWPSRFYVVSLLHGPERQELINGVVLATGELEAGLTTLGQVLVQAEQPTPDGLAVRYAAVEI